MPVSATVSVPVPVVTRTELDAAHKIRFYHLHFTCEIGSAILGHGSAPGKPQHFGPRAE